ncbi:MAG: hypothetical protein FWG98_13370 [Candidatus Cloacimonetes bacterium]|nr:hypothetical protein [Candidatus Cloacimonadota bacterium]
MKTNNISKKIIYLILLILPVLLSSQNFTGSGGQGITITVSEFLGVNLSNDELHILPLIQGNFIGILQRYSAMTVFDQQYIENILNQQNRSLAGDFSDINIGVILGISKNGGLNIHYRHTWFKETNTHAISIGMAGGWKDNLDN